MKIKLSRTTPKKILICFNLIIFSIVSMTLCYFTLRLEVYLLSFLFFCSTLASIYSFKIIKTVELIYDESEVIIGKTNVPYNSVLSVKKRKYNFIERIFWATSIDRIYIPPWDMFSIKYKEVTTEKEKSFIIDPISKFELMEFITILKSKNAQILIETN